MINKTICDHFIFIKCILRDTKKFRKKFRLLSISYPYLDSIFSSSQYKTRPPRILPISTEGVTTIENLLAGINCRSKIRRYCRNSSLSSSPVPRVDRVGVFRQPLNEVMIAVRLKGFFTSQYPSEINPYKNERIGMWCRLPTAGPTPPTTPVELIKSVCQPK